jgi:poly(A) polymerase Pap1
MSVWLAIAKRSCQLTDIRYYETDPHNLESIIFEQDLISNLLPPSIRPLNTYRDTAYLMKTLPEISAYRVAHRFIALYLKNRGLYSAKFGYLGGVHLQLMLNRLIKLMVAAQTCHKPDELAENIEIDTEDHQRLSPASIVKTFFDYYSQFHWNMAAVSNPIVGNPEQHRRIRDAVMISAIHTPTARANVASSCTRLSAGTFTREFTNAAKKISSGDWASCLGDAATNVQSFLRQYSTYVKLSVSIWDMETLGPEATRVMVGFVESRMPDLLLRLGEIEGIYARVWPDQFKQVHEGGVEEVSELDGAYLVGLSTTDKSDERSKKAVQGKILNVVRNFERTVKDREERFAGKSAWFQADIVSRAQLSSSNWVISNAI